jgi:hypothetical protein
MLDYIEAALALRVIDAADVDQAPEATLRIVAKKLERGDKLLVIDLNGELAKHHLARDKSGSKAICKISA